jgi:hypothetical protein
MSMVLYKAHATSILRRTITIREGSFKQGILSGLHPLSLIDLLHVIRGGFGS